MDKAKVSVNIDKVMEKWDTLKDTLLSVLTWTKSRYPPTPGELEVFYSDTFRKGKTDFDNLSTDRICGVLAHDKFEAGILLIFCRVLCDRDIYYATGIIYQLLDEKEYILDGNDVASIEDIATFMAKFREEYIVSSNDTDSTVFDSQIDNPLAKSYIRDLYQMTVVQPGIRDISDALSKLTLQDVKAWGWIES